MKKTIRKSNNDNLTIISDQYAKEILDGNGDEIRASVNLLSYINDRNTTGDLILLLEMFYG